MRMVHLDKCLRLSWNGSPTTTLAKLASLLHVCLKVKLRIQEMKTMILKVSRYKRRESVHRVYGKHCRVDISVTLSFKLVFVGFCFVSSSYSKNIPKQVFINLLYIYLIHLFYTHSSFSLFYKNITFFHNLFFKKKKMTLQQLMKKSLCLHLLMM